MSPSLLAQGSLASVAQERTKGRSCRTGKKASTISRLIIALALAVRLHS